MDNAPENTQNTHQASDNVSQADSATPLINHATPSRRSNSRALKVAGLTTLACLLLASQIFTAYMVIDQSKQINTLKKKSEEVSKLVRSVQVMKSSSMKMQRPINNSPMVMDVLMPEHEHQPPKATPGMKMQRPINNSPMVMDVLMPQHEHQPPKATPVSSVKTKCQVEAEPGHGKLGTYKPQCDEQGRYKAMQCWHSTGFCWCVDETGTVIEGTTMRGRPVCERGESLDTMPSVTPAPVELGGE